MNLQQLRQHVARFADHEMSGGVDDSQIAAASGAIGLPFPPQYVDFLRAAGTLGVSSEEVIGLGGPNHLDVVKLTNHLRSRPGRARFPSSLIPLSTDGFGNYDCIDTLSPTVQGEFAIVQWRHEGGDQQQRQVIADSFDEWFIGFLSEVSRLDAEQED